MVNSALHETSRASARNGKDTVSDLDLLHTATREQAAAYFADVDAEVLVAQVVATGDEALLTLIGREEVRPAAIEGLLNRLAEFAIAERLGEVKGVVRFDLERRGALLARHAVEFTGSDIVVGPEADHLTPDVVLRTSLLRFVRLISGERNAGLEYLSGKLDIDGDAMLALAVGGIFRVPGSDAVAVDPTQLDPIAVARALKGVSVDHLRKVMSSDFRGIVLDEIFRRLPDFLDERKAARARLSVGLRLLGNPSGDIERRVIDVHDGLATVTVGAEGESRDATVTLEGYDFLKLATGHLNAVSAVLKGQLKVRGDKAKALQLISLLDIPQAD